MTTLPPQLVIPPRNTDVEAWRARMEAKRAERRRHEMPGETAAPGPARGRGLAARSDYQAVRPCAECGHPTRPGRTSAEQYPGTRARQSHERCSTCHMRHQRVGGAS